MKLAILGLIVLAGVCFLAQPVDLYYKSCGIDDKIVARAICVWKMDGVRVHSTNDIKKADLIIRSVSPSRMWTHTNWGEQCGNVISVNESAKFCSTELTALISHEFGHFIFLPHNSDPNSMMNDKTALKTRNVSDSDLYNANFVKQRILIRKLFTEANSFLRTFDFLNN